MGPRTWNRLRLPRAFFFPEDDGKFVTADAGNQIVIAHAALHEGCGLTQNFIPHAVAKLVVVALEIVDVEQQQRDRKPHRAGPCPQSG